MATLGAGVIAGVLALYHHLQPWQAATGSLSQVFDLSAGGSLASWIASVMLLATSMASVMVLSMRRHKLSDYNGRYRVWAWTAAVTLLMSAAATAPFHLLAADALAELTGWDVPGGTTTFWLAPTALVLGMLAVRLLLDLRESRIASVTVVASILAYGGAIGMQLSDPASIALPRTVMILAGCKLAGHLMLLVSVMLFARHVLRDIQGLVKVREAKRKKEKQPKAKESPASAAKSTKTKKTKQGDRIDSPHDSAPAPRGISDLEPDKPTKRSKRSRAAIQEVEDEYDDEPRSGRRGGGSRKKKQRHQDFDDYDDFEPSGGSKMSKAQRKKLRKLKAQQRMANL